MKKLLFPVILSALTVILHAQKTEAFGIVFCDNNENRKFDADDIPLHGVAVSTLDTITRTDNNGTFRLPVTERDIVFIIKPSDFSCQIGPGNVPEFYYLNFPKGSPDYLTFKGIEPTPKLPDTLFFLLYKTSPRREYQANLIADIQAPTIREVRFFRESVLTELFNYPTDFSVCLGDIADNNLDIYSDINQSFSALDNPVFMVMGNHDLNYESPEFEFEAETFRRYYGPDYYSFNYGRTHFIVLNTVLYKGWNSKDSTGEYTGGLYPRQMKWLRQDLLLAEDVTQIVILAHIPLLPEYCDLQNLDEVFAMLEQVNKPILGIYGHLHRNVSWTYDEKSHWNGMQLFKGIVAGAASGSWYGGPYGLDSIPESMCTDGSPKGFYNLTFTDYWTRHEFIPAGKPVDYQMRISSPGAYIHADSLSKAGIYVNIFDSDGNCTVDYIIDDTLKGKMSITLEADPYVIANIERLKNKDDWYPGPSLCTHLWKAPLPENLQPGIHRIEVISVDFRGRVLKAKKIFEVISK